MRDLFILDADKRPVQEPDIMEWAKWTADHEHERLLAYTEIGDVRISTVFLGHACWPTSLSPDEPPILWETMVRGGAYDREICRYASHDEAMAGHAAVEKLVGCAIAAALVRGGGAPNDP